MSKQFSTKIAHWYSQATHNPSEAITTRCYDAFLSETAIQFRSIVNSGFKFEFTDSDPYLNSTDLYNDYLQGSFRVFLTGQDSGIPANHPMMTSYNDSLLFNDVFRAVHDYFGHCAIEKNSFGPIGEDKAFKCHRTMFSLVAIPALATETRCQNSWFNFGPHSDLKPNERPFADQKAIASPAWIAFR